MKKRKTIIWALSIPVAVSVALHILLAAAFPFNAEVDISTFEKHTTSRFGAIEVQQTGTTQLADGQPNDAEPIDAAEVLSKFSGIAADEPDIPPAAIDVAVQLPPAIESNAPPLPVSAAVSQWASDGIAAAASKAALLADIELPRKSARPLKRNEAEVSSDDAGGFMPSTGSSIHTVLPGEISFTDERPAAAHVQLQTPSPQPSAVTLPERPASHVKIPAVAWPE